MAEAVVDGAPMSRFFCHKCNVVIEPSLTDYTCPICTSGFIEQLEGDGGGSMGDDSSMSEDRAMLDGSSMDIGSVEFSDVDLDFGQRRNDDFIRMHFGFPRDYREMEDAGPTDFTQRVRDRIQQADSINAYRTRPEPIRSRRNLQQVENLIQNFILNLSGIGVHFPTDQGVHHQPVLLLGNPGDYVWGRDGLDTIVTQLLNQMDGSGPPPLPRKQIDEIPTAMVSQSQIDIKLQCSICWEDFILAELVRKLPCKHIYHTPCIEPWLELHGTCPICRQSLGDQTSADANRDTIAPSLAALFRAANQTSNRRAPSASSSSTSTSDE